MYAKHPTHKLINHKNISMAEQFKNYKQAAPHCCLQCGNYIFLYDRKIRPYRRSKCKQICYIVLNFQIMKTNFSYFDSRIFFCKLPDCYDYLKRLNEQKTIKN